MGDKKGFNIGEHYEEIRAALRMFIKFFGWGEKVQDFLTALIKKAAEVVPDISDDIVEVVVTDLVRAILQELGIEPK